MTLGDMPTTMPALIQAASDCFGDKRALVAEGNTLTYSQLNEQRLRYARAFLAAGLGHGDRFAIWSPNAIEWIIAAIAGQSIGAVLVPLNTRMKGGEAAYILNASGTKLVFTIEEFLGNHYLDALTSQDLPTLEHIVLLEGQNSRATSWQAFADGGEAVSDEALAGATAAVSGDDTLDILFTSGTTGKPKGVITSHAQNIRTFTQWGSTVGLTDNDNYLIINPFFHSFGYKAGWLAAFLFGATVFPVVQFDVDAVLEQISRDRISVIPGPPTIYHSLLNHPARAQSDLSSLRLAVTGAAAVPVELVRRMRDDLGFATVVTAYGLTESCGVVSICRPDDSPERIATTSGRAMDGVEMRCVDADGNVVAPGEEGEIRCRGFNVMQGYLDNPDATASTITEDGWLCTGDVGVMDEHGYVRITDRLKDMFIVGGFNCYPAEIENSLCSMPGVAQAAVIGVPHERLGEVPCAFIVPTPEGELSEEGVIAWAREAMANYKVPRSVHLVKELPLNASGKVVKDRLREQAAKA